MQRPFLLLIASFAVAATTLIPSTARSEMSLAVIDLQRAIADTEDGLRMRAQLQQMVDASKVEFENKRKALEAAKAEFQRLQKQKVPQQTLQQKYVELEKMNYDLGIAQQQSERGIIKKENELTVPILNALMGLVRQVAAQNGYDMVLAKQAAPYFRKDLDITDRVIQMYNASQSPSAAPKGRRGPGGAQGATPSPRRAPAPGRAAGPKGKSSPPPAASAARRAKRLRAKEHHRPARATPAASVPTPRDRRSAPAR
ncbi:MAG: OmpH family outer membrane protein [Myxococcota bacterium]